MITAEVPAAGNRSARRSERDDEWNRRRREELLDDALTETFPASDPISIAEPHRDPNVPEMPNG